MSEGERPVFVRQPTMYGPPASPPPSLGLGRFNSPLSELAPPPSYNNVDDVFAENIVYDVDKAINEITLWKKPRPDAASCAGLLVGQQIESWRDLTSWLIGRFQTSAVAAISDMPPAEFQNASRRIAEYKKSLEEKRTDVDPHMIRDVIHCAKSNIQPPMVREQPRAITSIMSSDNKQMTSSTSMSMNMAMKAQTDQEIMRIVSLLRPLAVEATADRDTPVQAQADTSELLSNTEHALKGAVSNEMMTNGDTNLRNPLFRQKIYVDKIVAYWKDNEEEEEEDEQAPRAAMPTAEGAVTIDIKAPTAITDTPPRALPPSLVVPRYTERDIAPPSSAGGYYMGGYYGGRLGGTVPSRLRERVNIIVSTVTRIMAYPGTSFGSSSAIGLHQGSPDGTTDMPNYAHYIPTMPQISAVQRSTQPCMFEHRIQRGPGFWKWACERAGKPGIKKCALKRVERDQSTLVPMNCMQEYVNVLKGYNVDRRTTMTKDGQKITQQFITPEVAVVGNVRKMGPAGPGVPVRLTKDEEAELKTFRTQQSQGMSPYGALLTEGETMMFGGRGAGRHRSSPNLVGQQRQAGAATTGAQVGGRDIRLPSRTAMRQKEVQFGTEDIQNFELGTMPGVIQDPFMAAKEGLKPIEPNEIGFYTYDDSYGTTNMRHRTFGFTFSFRHLPYAYMTQQAYLEWLVSLSYRLRHEWSQYHNHVYDPLKDTIATVESYIMVTLGRLEKYNKFFSRKELFAGASEFRAVMHPILAAFAFRPPQRTWYSPLSARYLEDANGTEVAAIDNIEGITRALANTMFTELNVKDSVTYATEDSYIMAIVEDVLLAYLARLQFLHGYALNTFYGPPVLVNAADYTAVSIRGATAELLSTIDATSGTGAPGAQRRFLTKELARYLELFQLEDEAKPLHYLSELRKRQAQQMGLVLPKTQMPGLTTNGVSLPFVAAAPGIKPDEYQTFSATPAVTTLVAAPSAYVVPIGNFGGAQNQQQRAVRRS
jgi:hypothetical protein